MKVILLFSLLFCFSCNAQSGKQDYSDQDKKIFKEKIQLVKEKDLFNKPINEVIVEIGKSFIGTEYKGFVLEKDGEEHLVVNLRELDCTTYLENVLAISHCIKKNKTAFEDFLNELKTIRYRDGIINRYPSRLHYFTDWIYNNQKKNIVEDITKQIGGEPLKLNLNFMSTHPESYKQLNENPEFTSEIEKQEKEISSREYYFIPKTNIEKTESKIENGDMIAFTSNIKGLDVNHVGIAVRMKDDRIHILHAPEPGTKVQITQLALPEYISKIKHDTGIIVFRAIEPYQ
jgi:N-acetylmuramoyl-L-alanine amidase-like